MGYFDGLVDSSFKKDENGNDVFYRWGIFGKGVLLEDDSTKNGLRESLKTYYIVILPLAIVCGIYRNWILIAAVLLIAGIWYFVLTNKFVRGLSASGEKLSFTESSERSAKSHNLGTLWLLLMSSILFVVGGFFMLFDSDEGILLPVFLVLLFGACAFAIGNMIRLRRK